MAVDASAYVQLLNGVSTLGSVRVGDTCLTRDSQSPITEVHERRSQAITIHTSGGYRLTCTPNQQLRTPSGWVEARDAVELVMRGYSNRTEFSVPTNPRDALSRSNEALVEALRVDVKRESTGGLDLVLNCTSDLSAFRAQYALLALGLPCVRRDDRLVVAQPFAGEYGRVVGCVKDSVQEFLAQGSRLISVTLSRGVQRVIAELLAKQGLDSHKGNVNEMRELQELSSLVVAGELRQDEAMRMAHLLGTLPATDAFLRHRLVTLIRSQCTNEFTVRVSRTLPTNRLDMIELIGTDYLADGFVCRMARKGF